MGRRGPAPKPTELRVLHGDRASSINRAAPVARAGSPEPPDDLSTDVREVWDYTLAEIGAMRIARPADRDALVAYCEAVVMHRRASRLLVNEELLIIGQKLNVVRNPLVQMQRDAAMTVKAFAAEFGLTPRARSEFRAPGGKDADERKKERLLS